MLIDTYKKLYTILTARERRQLFFVLILYLMRGPIEVIGIASIMPFLAVAANPELIKTNAYLSAMRDYSSFSTNTAFLQFLGLAVLSLILLRIVVEALARYATIRFSMMRTYSLSYRLLSSYLRQPYEWFLRRHSADLGKSVLTEVEQVVRGALMPSLNFLSDIFVVFLVVALVVAVDPVVALVSASTVGLIYGTVYVFSRKYLALIGVDRIDANRERYQIAQEATGGIKDVKVLGLEHGYTRRFRNPASRFARHQASSMIIGMLPAYGLQVLTYAGGVLLVLWLMVSRGGDLGSVLALIGLYALAAQRLMPAMGSIFQSVTAIRFGKPALDSLVADMRAAEGIESENHATDTDDKLSVTERLDLKGVTFTYAGAMRPAVKNLSLSIAVNSTVGIVGSTGAGKTTVVDIILGLLMPQEGRVCVDGEPVTSNNLRAWQRSVGYVSQHIFLADDTVAANIAFGAPPERIDMAAVERAARISELHDFIIQELPQGYDTFVGERGVRLSGGQRQRIGIARALYNDPDLLVLDEATSALDNMTEKAVMDAVAKLGGRKTIVMIAHRLSTVRNCDQIIMLEKGQVAATGTYDELMSQNAAFRKMAGASA